MRRFICCALLLLALSIAVVTQQSPTSAPWNVTIKTNTVVNSDLTVVNQCKKTHQFQIQLQDVPFLKLSANQATVKGGQTSALPVKFDTTNFAPGVYKGTATVLCQTCKSEPTCTQDREVLQVILNVIGDPVVQGASSTPTPQSQQTPANTPSGSGVPFYSRVAAFELAGKTVHVEGSPDDSFGTETRKFWKIKIKTPGGKVEEVFIASVQKPDLKFCDYIKVLTSHDSSTLAMIDTWEKTEKPPEKPAEPKRDDTKPVTDAPKTETSKTGGGETTIPPCKEGTVRIVGSEELTVDLLDGKQEMFPKIYTDKDSAANAAQEFSDYLKKIAEKGGEISDDLPEGDGPGGAVVDFLLKYLEQGGTIIDEVLKGSARYAGVTEFTATLDVGLRHIVAKCTTLEICKGGKWVTEKHFSQSESKDRRRYTKVWCKIPGCEAKYRPGKGEKDVLESGDWSAISDSNEKFDPEKAGNAGKDFFKEMANILKKGADDLKEFKDKCK